MILAVADIIEDIVLDMVTNRVQICSIQRKINRHLLANTTEATWAYN